MKLQQITIPLENQSGRLHAVTRQMGDRGINIVALSVVDSGHFGQMRLLVSDLRAARQLLMQGQIPARVETVIAAVLDNGPGSFGRLSGLLQAAGIHIRYSYAAASQRTGRVALVLALSDNDGAERLLEKHGVPMLEAADMTADRPSLRATA
jgi:hypothetical protein